jgi:hypothetical protein
MATFDTLIDDLATRFGLGPNARSLIKEILSLISTSPGGMSGFLDKFKSAGLASEVASWVGHPGAAPVAAGQIERALGATALGGNGPSYKLAIYSRVRVSGQGGLLFVVPETLGPRLGPPLARTARQAV